VPRRSLPPELTDRLRAASALEGVADSHARRQWAIAATSRLLYAARQAGWRPTELADAIEANPWTIARRTRVAAAAGTATGLVVPRPATPAPPPRDVTPLAERDWLRSGEVCILLKVASSTLAQWRSEGLTPGAEFRNGYWWFPREDLQRLAQAPRRQGGVDRAAVRRRIKDGLP